VTLRLRSRQVVDQPQRVPFDALLVTGVGNLYVSKCATPTKEPGYVTEKKSATPHSGFHPSLWSPEGIMIYS
jgi:hypothetical protein